MWKALLRLFLLPVSLLYGLVIGIRNMLFKTGIWTSTKFDFPVISVGNLSMGGTGKTPHIEYLVRLLKRNNFHPATLSRGYGRKTSGFAEVEVGSTAEETGDEPLQYKIKFPDITVAVGENRQLAIPDILSDHPETDAILLDDAFQHRSVKPGISILLTDYSNLFVNKWLLPSGELREWRAGYKRADIIIVSKCIKVLSPLERRAILDRIKPLSHQHVYFSYMEYQPLYAFSNHEKTIALEKESQVVLLSGIARPGDLEYYIGQNADLKKTLKFNDHHFYTRRDLNKIKKAFSKLTGHKKMVITTEKDAARLNLHKEWIEKENITIYIQPVKVKFHHDDGELFDNQILNYIKDEINNHKTSK